MKCPVPRTDHDQLREIGSGQRRHVDGSAARPSLLPHRLGGCQICLGGRVPHGGDQRFGVAEAGHRGCRDKEFPGRQALAACPRRLIGGRPFRWRHCRICDSPDGRLNDDQRAHGLRNHRRGQQRRGAAGGVPDQMRAAEFGQQCCDVIFVGLPSHLSRREALAVSAPVHHDQAKFVGQRPLFAKGVTAPATGAMNQKHRVAAAADFRMEVSHPPILRLGRGLRRGSRSAEWREPPRFGWRPG